MKYNVPQNWRELCQDPAMREVHELREEVNKLRAVIKYAKATWPACDYLRLKAAIVE